jgi:hypothetical protein
MIAWTRLEQYARHWLLMPIILAIQKAEIRRIMVWGQYRQIIHKILSQKYATQLTWKSCLPGRREVLSLNPILETKKKKKRIGSDRGINDRVQVCLE